jgi:hypothetical protein
MPTVREIEATSLNCCEEIERIGMSLKDDIINRGDVLLACENQSTVAALVGGGTQKSSPRYTWIDEGMKLIRKLITNIVISPISITLNRTYETGLEQCFEGWNTSNVNIKCYHRRLRHCLNSLNGKLSSIKGGASTNKVRQDP